MLEPSEECEGDSDCSNGYCSGCICYPATPTTIPTTSPTTTPTTITITTTSVPECEIDAGCDDDGVFWNGEEVYVGGRCCCSVSKESGQI